MEDPGDMSCLALRFLGLLLGVLTVEDCDETPSTLYFFGVLSIEGGRLVSKGGAFIMRNPTSSNALICSSSRLPHGCGSIRLTCARVIRLPPSCTFIFLLGVTTGLVGSC